MTDLSDLLDSRMDERIMHAINDLDFNGFISLITEMLGSIGVNVTKTESSDDAVFFEGVGEDGKFFVVASRLFDNASVESMKVLKEMAGKRGATPVLVVTCDLDPEEKKFAEAEEISYADKPKLLTLLRKYDLTGKMMTELDRSILEKERNRYLPSGAQFDSFYNKAEEHFKQNRYRDALYNYDRALDIKPNNDTVWLRKASVFLAMGRYQDALVACKRASELRPGDATTWYLMGLAYNQLGDFEKELKAYDVALKIQPRMEAALLNKGATLFQLHRYDWALKVYEEMCNFFPKDAMAFNNRGIVLKAMGRNKEALESFDRASFLNRNYIDPVINRALTLAGTGRHTEAIEAWNDALQIDRKRADIWFSLGMSQKTMGLLGEAVLSFETAASLDSELIEAVTERNDIMAAMAVAKSTEEVPPAEVVEPVPDKAPEIVTEQIPQNVEPSTAVPEPERLEEGPVRPEVAEIGIVQPPEPLVAEVIPPVLAEEELPAVESEEVSVKAVPSEESTIKASESLVPEASPAIAKEELPSVEVAVNADEAATQPEEIPTEVATLREEIAPAIAEEELPVAEAEGIPEAVVTTSEETAPAPVEAEGQPSTETAVVSETSVPYLEEVEVEAPAESPSPVTEEPAPETVLKAIPKTEEAALALVGGEVALVSKGPSSNEVQKIDDKTSVVPMGQTSVPAVLEAHGLALKDGDGHSSEVQKIDDKTSVVPMGQTSVPAVLEAHGLALKERTRLPTILDEKKAMAVQPEEVPLPAQTSEIGTAIVLPAEASLIEVPHVTTESIPLVGVKTTPSEPVSDVPLEPEVPISDRELKAAIILNVLGENARALEEIDRYIRDKSESHDARHIKANILADLGRLPECLEELKEAIRLDPKDEIALMDIEAISSRLGRKEESMRILASITPSQEVRAREAVSLLDAKRYDEVISRFTNLGQLDSLVARMCVATSLMAKARYRDAYRILKDILLEHPAYPEALNNMGVCMRFMGEYGYDEPMHFMHLAVEADPNYGDAWNNIGATLFVLGDYAGAMDALCKAIAVDRRSDYLINLSKCQIMVGDIDGAKLSLTSALQYEETAEIDFALGLIAEKEGDMKWALKLYDSAIELHPNFKDAIFNRQRVKLFLKYTQK